MRWLGGRRRKGRDREEVSGEEEKQEAFIGHGRTKKGEKKSE